jgi:putative two-component system response regulator
MDRVLIVDDEPGLRGLMCRWAEALGWRAQGVAAADEALAELTGNRYDVVVVPVGSSPADGLWLAGRLRERQVETGVVLTAGTGSMDAAVNAVRSGVADYLLKPFECERFREAIDRARDSQRAAADTERRRRSVASDLAARRQQLSEAVAALDLGTDAAVRAVLAILTVRDRSTFDHSLRVADLARRLASALGLGTALTADVERAALVHELTRVVVPETVLWKTGPLTVEEWELLRSQPEYAYRLLNGQPHLSGAALVLRAVREKFDGTGYPNSLAGDAIPVGARILAVADAYDTMTRPQTHRDPLAPSEVATEIAAGRGTQFDPQVVDALTSLVLRR